MQFIGSPYNFAGAPPPSFSPSDVAGLQTWLKADAITGLSDGDPVATWEDSHTSNRDATQSSSSARPIYKTNILNGLPVVRFNGVDQYFDVGDFSALAAGEIFLVFKRTAHPPAADLETGLWMWGGSGQNAHVPFTDTHIYEEFGANTRRDIGVCPVNLSTAAHIYSLFSAPNDWEASFDGTPFYSSTSNTVLFSVNTTLGKSRTIYYFKGDIAEVIFYDSKLSTGNRNSVISYLQGKYSI